MAAPRLVVPRPLPAGGRRSPGTPLFLTVAGLLAAAFLLAPWPLAHKAHAALHGLCAQRPSHSFSLGGEPLPFDARMTGIYGGFLSAGVLLAVRGRFRSAGIPPLRVIGVLGLGVAAMAADGTNALLVDLGWWHPYPPDNRLRLATGLAAGVAMAVVIAFLVASSLWWRPRAASPCVGGLRELGVLGLAGLPFAAVVLSGWGWLLAPVTLALVVGAVAVVTLLSLVVLALLAEGPASVLAGREHHLPPAALVLGVGAMAAIAAARFLLERLVGAPPLV